MPAIQPTFLSRSASLIQACVAGVLPGDRQILDRLRTLTADVGGRWHELQDDEPARAIARFARQRHITQIVVGASRRSRWRQITGGGSNVGHVIREAGANGIDVHVIARDLPPANRAD